MLSAAGGTNSNDIVFRMMLEVDPRYRNAMQTLKKEALQTQADIVKGSEVAETKKTAIVEAAEKKRVSVQKKTADQFFADIERREALWMRVQNNILASANARHSQIMNARAAFERRVPGAMRRDQYDTDVRRAVVESQKAYEQYQREIERTDVLQRTQSLRAVEGIRQVTEGLGNAARAAGALGIALGLDMEKAVRTFALIEAGIAGVRAATGVGRGVRTLMTSAAGGSALAAGGLTALGVGAGAGVLAGGIYGLGALDNWASASRDRRRPFLRDRASMQWQNRINQFEFEQGAGESARILDRNSIYRSMGVRGADSGDAWSQYVIDDNRRRGAEAMANYERARRGKGLRIGGGGAFREVNLSPDVALQEQGRFAAQAAEHARLEFEAVKQIEESRKRQRDLAAEGSRIALDGAYRLSGIINDQIASERERSRLKARENQTIFQAFGQMSPAERNQFNRNIASIRANGGTRQQRDQIIPFGGEIGELGRRAAEREGRAAAKNTELERFLADDVTDAIRNAALQTLANAIKKSLTGNAQAIADAVKKALDQRDEDAAKAIVQANDKTQKIQELVQQKQKEGEAAIRQAER